MKSIDSKGKKPTYLSFGLGKENYAVSTTSVLEVLEPQYITPVPNSLEFIEGIITFRGNIVPVVCLHRKLNLPRQNGTTSNVIIIFDTILNKKKTTIAALADDVNEVLAANDSEILPVPKTGIAFDKDFLKGMIKHKQSFVLVFDIDKVFAI